MLVIQNLLSVGGITRLSIACTIAPGFSGSYTACERGTFYKVNASCHLSNHANGARVSKSYYMVTKMIWSSSNSQNSSRGWNFHSWPSANIMTSSFQGAIISAKYPQLQYKMIDTRPKVFRTKPFHIMGLWDKMNTGNFKNNFDMWWQARFSSCWSIFFPNRI